MAKTIRAGGLKIDLGLNLANLSADVKSATGSIKSLEKNITSIAGNIQKAFQAALVVGGVIAVKNFGDALLDLADKGEAAGSIAEGFEKLGGSAAEIDKAREATIGLVDSFDLMEVANRGLVAGVQDFGGNFAEIAELGARLANTLNTDTKGAIQEVTEAFVAGKEKGFENLGFIIDAGKAYKDFAKDNNLLVEALDVTQKKQALQAQAMEQLPKVIGRLAPVTDSAANAADALSNAWGEMLKNVGIAINENEDLREALRGLGDQISQIDLKAFADGLASVFSIAVKVAEGIAFITRNVIDLGNAIADSLKVNVVSEQAAKLEIANANAFITSKRIEGDKRSVAELTNEYVKLQQAGDESVKTISAGTLNLFDLTKDLNNEVEKSSTKPSKSQSQLDEEAKRTKAAVSAMAKATEEYQESLRKLTGQSAIPAVSKELEQIFIQFRNQEISAEEAERAINALSQSYRKSPESMRQFKTALDEADKSAADTIDEIEDLNKELEKLANNPWTKDFADDLESAKQGGGIFGSIFDDLFSDDAGNSGTPEAIEKGREFGEQLGGNIASGLQEAMVLALNGGKGEDFRALISSTVFDIGANFADSVLPGSGQFVQIFEPLFGKGLEKLFGGEHAGTTARKEADKFFADAFDAQRLSVIVNGELIKIKDLVFKGETLFGGSSQFTDGSFSTFFQTLSDDARRGFAGVGLAFEEILGIGEDVAGQLAAVFANNIGGSLNNLQLLIQSTGKSTEELMTAVEESFLDSNISALEAQSALIGIQQVAEDGIPGALGAITEAFTNFIVAGPKGGRAVIDAIKDIAHEAKEVNKDFAGAEQALLDSGQFDPELIKQTFQALRDSGIDTIEELINAPTQQLIGVIASLESANFPFEEAQKTIQELSQELEGIDEHLEKELVIKVKTVVDDQTQEALDAGVFEGTGLDQVGNSGTNSNQATLRSANLRSNSLSSEVSADGIIPARSSNFNSSFSSGGSRVAGGLIINIDARNSERGVEQDVIAAISQMEDRLVNRTAQVVIEGAERGRY